MPMPTAPRRTGPPRKKAFKSPSPAQTTDGPLVTSPEPEIVTSPPLGDALTTPAEPKVEDASLGVPPPAREDVTEGSFSEPAPSDQEPVAADTEKSLVPEETKQVPENEPQVESEDPAADEDSEYEHERASPTNEHAQSDGVESETPVESFEPSEESHVEESHESAHPHPEEADVSEPEDAGPASDTEEISDAPQQVPEPEPSPQPEPETVEESTPAAAVNEEDEDDEAARRQRIAARMAKMGGFNPFGAPASRQQSTEVPASTSPPPAIPARPEETHAASEETSENGEY